MLRRLIFALAVSMAAVAVIRSGANAGTSLQVVAGLSHETVATGSPVTYSVEFGRALPQLTAVSYQFQFLSEDRLDPGECLTFAGGAIESGFCNLTGAPLEHRGLEFPCSTFRDVCLALSDGTETGQVEASRDGGGEPASVEVYTLTVIAYFEPAVDDFADAFTIARQDLWFYDTIETSGGTVEPDEPAACSPSGLAIGATVWYAFRSDTDLIVEATTLYSDFDTVLAAYTGESLGELEEVACNNDFESPQSQLVLPVSSGQMVYFQVGGVGGATGHLQFGLGPHIIEVGVDVKPGSTDNNVNQRSKMFYMALLGSPSFDVSEVEYVSQEGPLPLRSSFRDVNQDHRIDMVLGFDPGILDIGVGSTEACLVGRARSGQPFGGCDSIRIFCPCKPRPH